MLELGNFAIAGEADRVGDRARISLRLDLPEGVHIEPHQPSDPFFIPTVVTVEDITDVTVNYPTPVEKNLGWKDSVLTVLEGMVEFIVHGTVADDAEVITGTIRYQPCIGGACLPPQVTAWSVALPVPADACTGSGPVAG